MARRCDLTGARAYVGNKVSHANNKTKIRKQVNLISKRYFVAKLGEYVRVKISTRGLRTIDKFGGLEGYLVKTPNADLSENLLVIKKRIRAV